MSLVVLAAIDTSATVRAVVDGDKGYEVIVVAAAHVVVDIVDVWIAILTEWVGLGFASVHYALKKANLVIIKSRNRVLVVNIIASRI